MRSLATLLGEKASVVAQTVRRPDGFVFFFCRNSFGAGPDGGRRVLYIERIGGAGRAGPVSARRVVWVTLRSDNGSPSASDDLFLAAFRGHADGKTPRGYIESERAVGKKGLGEAHL